MKNRAGRQLLIHHVVNGVFGLVEGGTQVSIVPNEHSSNRAQLQVYVLEGDSPVVLLERMMVFVYAQSADNMKFTYRQSRNLIIPPWKIEDRVC